MFFTLEGNDDGHLVVCLPDLIVSQMLRHAQKTKATLLLVIGLSLECGIVLVSVVLGSRDVFALQRSR